MRYRRTLATAKRLNEIVGLLIQYGFEELIEQDAAVAARRWLREQFGREEADPDKETLKASERARLLL